jgi:methionine-rich copper-binding protein CopC
MQKRLLRSGLLLMLVLVSAWTAFHIELVDSLPKADQVLETAPDTVWLKFKPAPDASRSSFSISGPVGVIDLSEINLDPGDETVLQASVEGELVPGDYLVSWVAAPMDDHAVRGRFGFTIAERR